MKTLTAFGLILIQSLAVFAQNKPIPKNDPVKTTTVSPASVQNDTLSFAYITDKNGKPVLDSSDCFIIGDMQAAKLLVFPVNASATDLMDDFLFADNSKTKQNVSYYKCIIPKGASGGSQYATIQKTLEAKLRIKLKMPNLRIRLVWAAGLSSEDAEVNFVK
jgi:hypothetical protein